MSPAHEPAIASRRERPEPDPAPRSELSRLACRAAAGDERAWADLVTRLGPVLRAVVKRYRLGPAEAEDVVQTTWLRALRCLEDLNDPGAIAGWLIATARREALRALQRGVREVVADDPRPEDESDRRSPEGVVLERERRAAVRRAVARLSGRQRELIASLLAVPTPTYEQISARLRMPIGSIGPTRDRALVRLRADPELAGLVAL